MKYYTKFLHEKRVQDLKRIWARNNSKIANRTPEENKQAYEAHVNFYLGKWYDYLDDAETPAQKAICEQMIDRIKRTPKWY